MQSEAQAIFRSAPYSKSRPAPAARDFAGQPEAPFSAARLAAEQAFSKPNPQSLPDDPPLVVVRRAKVLLADADQGAAQAVVHARPASETRRPRVFQINPGLQARSAQPGRYAGDPAYADDANGSNVNGAEPLPPVKRIGTDRLPGPVLQLFRSVARAAPKGDEPPAQMAQMAISRPQVTQLAQKLARLQTVLDAIRRAQSYEVLDPADTNDWRRLSQAADDIQSQLHRRLG